MYHDPVFGRDMPVESTMLCDETGAEIFTGNTIRTAVTGNTDLHGDWAEYLVSKGPGGYVLRYLRSARGRVLPEGYTGNYMADSFPPGNEFDLKQLVFALSTIRITGWRITATAPERPVPRT